MKSMAALIREIVVGSMRAGASSPSSNVSKSYIQKRNTKSTVKGKVTSKARTGPDQGSDQSSWVKDRVKNW